MRWVLGGYRGNRVGTDRELGWGSRVKSRSCCRGCTSLRVHVGVVVGACRWNFSRRSILRWHGGVTMLRNARIVIRSRIHSRVCLTWSCGIKKRIKVKQEIENKALLQTDGGLLNRVPDRPLSNFPKQLIIKRFSQKRSRSDDPRLIQGVLQRTTELPLIFITKSNEFITD